MAEEGDSGSSQRISKFNGTIAQLMRLDDLWKRSHNLATGGKLMSWNWVLDRIWCELSEDTKEDDKNEKKFWDFAQEISTNKKSADLLYSSLMKKEMFLRKLQNNQGKGTAYEDPESDW